MNFFKQSMYGFFPAVITAILLYINNTYWQNEIVTFLIYTVIPLLLCLFLVFKISNIKNFINILSPLAIYWVSISVFEFIVYRYWELYRTPAGGLYSIYDLDAIYPFIGIFIIIFAFIFSLLIKLIFIFCKKSYLKYIKQKTVL